MVDYYFIDDDRVHGKSGLYRFVLGYTFFIL